MLCVSIAEKGFENIAKQILLSDMAEVRLETSELSENEVRKLFKMHKNLVATCRRQKISKNKQKAMLMAAIDGGAAWVDIEIDADKKYFKDISKYAKNKGCKVILSYHNYKKTPKNKTLRNLINKAAKTNCNLIKIATQVNSLKDSARLLSLYQLDAPILALGMGDLGKITRVAALKLGAPFTFVCSDETKKTAEGQISKNKLNGILKSL